MQLQERRPAWHHLGERERLVENDQETATPQRSADLAVEQKRLELLMTARTLVVGLVRRRGVVKVGRIKNEPQVRRQRDDRCRGIEVLIDLNQDVDAWLRRGRKVRISAGISHSSRGGRRLIGIGRRPLCC